MGQVLDSGPLIHGPEEADMQAWKHPALIVSIVALFAALSGGAIAGTLISGSQIKNHSIPAKKLTRSAIKSLHGLRGPAGLQGPPGPKGDTGATGPIGPSSATSVSSPAAQGVGTSFVTVATLKVSAGSYVVMGNATAADSIDAAVIVCTLDDSVAGTIDINSTATTVNAARASLHLLGPLVTNGSTVTIDCISSSANDSAFGVHLVAIKVGSVTGS
jgi:hypothetical protein